MFNFYVKIFSQKPTYRFLDDDVSFRVATISCNLVFNDENNKNNAVACRVRLSNGHIQNESFARSQFEFFFTSKFLN